MLFRSPMFGTSEDLKAQVDSYRKIATALEKEGITPEQKADLEAQEELNPLFRLTKTLGLTNDRAVGAFIKAQEKALRALGGVTPVTKAPTPSVTVPNSPEPQIGFGQPVPPPEPDPATKAFLREFEQPGGLDYATRPAQVLEARDKLRDATYAVLAKKFNVQPERLGSSVYNTPPWKVVRKNPEKFDALLRALPAAEREAVYNEIMSSARHTSYSSITAAGERLMFGDKKSPYGGFQKTVDKLPTPEGKY